MAAQAAPAPNSAAAPAAPVCIGAAATLFTELATLDATLTTLDTSLDLLDNEPAWLDTEPATLDNELAWLDTEPAWLDKLLDIEPASLDKLLDTPLTALLMGPVVVVVWSWGARWTMRPGAAGLRAFAEAPAASAARKMSDKRIVMRSEDV